MLVIPVIIITTSTTTILFIRETNSPWGLSVEPLKKEML